MYLLAIATLSEPTLGSSKECCKPAPSPSARTCKNWWDAQGTAHPCGSGFDKVEENANTKIADVSDDATNKKQCCKPKPKTKTTCKDYIIRMNGERGACGTGYVIDPDKSNDEVSPGVTLMMAHLIPDDQLSCCQRKGSSTTDRKERKCYLK